MRTKKFLSIILCLCMLVGFCQFNLTVFAAGTVTMDSTELNSGVQSFSFNVSGDLDYWWAAIYPASNTAYPGGQYYDYVEMTSGGNGTFNFPSGSSSRYKHGWPLPDGEYQIVLFADGGYTNVASTVKFTVAPIDVPSEYYIKKGGTGNGTSVDTPAGSVISIVNKINSDGHGAGDLVTVYVIDSGEGSKTAIDSDCVIGYNDTNTNQVPEHAATIKYTSYDPDTVISILGHNKWLGNNQNSAHWTVSGPSIFEDINIIDMRNSNSGGTDIYLNHWPVEFHNVRFGDLDTANKVFYPSSTHFSMGMIRGRKTVNRDQYVYLDNADIIGDYLNIMGYNDSATNQGTSGNVTLEVGSGTIKNLDITSSNAVETEVIGGDLTIILGDGVTVQKINTTSIPVITGVFNFIQGYGSTIPAYTNTPWATTAKTSKTPYYNLIAGSANVEIGTTETAGTFDVSGTGVAYAVSEDRKTVYYGDGSVSVVPGVYTVNVAADLDAVKAAVNVPEEDVLGNPFNGWDEVAPGKLVAVYGSGDEGVPTEFYVQYGGTGLGGTVESPAGSIAAVVATINELYPDGGDVTVNVMKHANEPTDNKFDSADDCVYLEWQNIPAHNAKITYKSYSTSEVSSIVFKNTWQSSGTNGHIFMMGPTVFDGIRILDTRTDGATGDIYCNNHDIEFKNTPILVSRKQDAYEFTPWTSGHFNVGGLRNNSTLSKNPGTVVLDATAINHMADFNMSGYADQNGSNNVKIPENTTAYLTGGTLNIFRIDGSSASYTASFAKNVNVVLDGTSVKTFENRNTPNIKGALQVIRNNGASLAAMPDLTCDVYDITAGNGVTLDITDTTGTFSVECNGIAYAVSADGRTIYYGTDTLTLDPGVYTVNVAASVDEIVDTAQEPSHTVSYRFDGWDRSEEGVIKAILTFVGTGEAAYFVMNGGTGNGLTPTSPVDTIADAVNAINLAGYTADDKVTIYVMDACDKPYLYDKNGNSVIGVNFEGNQNSKQYLSRVTSWASLNGAPAACAANITIEAYDYETTGKNTWLIWNPIYGFNCNMTFLSNYTFKNINLLGPRPYDREYFINGYNVAFEDCKFYFLTMDAHSNTGIYEGTLFERQKFMLAGAAGGGGTLRINSPFVQAADTEYGVHIAGTGGGTYSNHVTIELVHDDISTVVYWGGDKNAQFNDGLTLIVDNTAEVTAFTAKNNSVTIDNGFELISMFGNSVSDLELPSNVVVSGGIWNIKVDSDGMFIKPTETRGVYNITDPNLVAVAGDETTGATYVSKDGVLTLPAGTFTVSSIPASEITGSQVEIYFDNIPAEGTYLKGYTVYLPTLDDKLLEDFVGWWCDYDQQVYPGGTLFEIPDDADIIYFDPEYVPVPDTVAVFVDNANGDDTTNDGSQEAPVKTLAKAYELVLADSNSIKKVVIVGEYEYSGILPKNTSPIIITGDGTGNSVFDLNDDCITLAGDITFENISLTHTTTGGGKVLNSEIYTLTFGENVQMKDDYVSAASVRIGGFAARNGAIKGNFHSGTFGTVEAGHFWCSGSRGTVTSADLLIDGATIGTLSFTSNGWQTTQLGCDFTGAVRITVNSGSLGKIMHTSKESGSEKYAEFKDTFSVILNNGETASVEEAINAANGVWVMASEKKDGCYLEYTTTAGTFKVAGSMTALATENTTGAQYVSTEGTLTVPAGRYTVTYVDEIFYINNGTEITVYNDCTLDLSTIKHNDIEGKLFIGWQMADGTACALKGNYKSGDVLQAQYVDFDLAGDFFISGAQIRTEGVQGLRFIVDKDRAFFDALPEVSEFGTLVLPTTATWGRDMFIDKAQVAEWGWDAETKTIFTPKTTNGYTPSKVVGEKIYRRTADTEQYTLCITNISEDKYYRYYTVKGYAIYKDLNGIENIIYSDYYQTNIYEVALEAIKEGEAPSDVFEGIKEYVEVDRKAAYMAENYDGRKLLSGYPSTSDTDPNHAMYQLTNGIKVREVEIDTGIGGDEVEIIHFADTHLNYINQKDMDLGEINTLSTYRGRSWLRNGSSVPNIARAMEYASFFDKAVITGDVMDYFSWGCAEIMTKMIVDQNKGKMLMAMGNHEPAERMQADMSGLSDKYTLAQRYEVLQEMWTNDIIYHSEIVKNDDGTEKVMLVVLDNQRDQYWGDQQAVPLARDIEIAREKGIPILIFEHDPICTKNPNEKAVDYFYEPGDTSGMPCDMSNRFAGSTSKSDADTMKVYNLIVQNPDVIKGIFCGHWHNHMYTEVLAQNADGSFMTDGNGNYVVIPQHIVTANAYGQGNVIKITVK